MGNLCAAGHGIVRRGEYGVQLGYGNKRNNNKRSSSKWAPSSTTSDRNSANSSSAKVVLVDGSVFRFRAPIKAEEVVKLVLATGRGTDDSDHDWASCCNNDRRRHGDELMMVLCPLKPGLHSLSILPPDHQLQLGHLYLLLPSKLLKTTTTSASPHPHVPNYVREGTKSCNNHIDITDGHGHVHQRRHIHHRRSKSAAAIAMTVDHPSPPFMIMHPPQQPQQHPPLAPADNSNPRNTSCSDAAAVASNYYHPIIDHAAAYAQVHGMDATQSTHNNNHLKKLLLNLHPEDLDSTSTITAPNTNTTTAASAETSTLPSTDLQMRSQSDVGCGRSRARAATMRHFHDSGAIARCSRPVKDKHTILSRSAPRPPAAAQNCGKMQPLAMASTAAGDHQGGTSNYSAHVRILRKCSKASTHVVVVDAAARDLEAVSAAAGHSTSHSHGSRSRRNRSRSIDQDRLNDNSRTHYEGQDQRRQLLMGQQSMRSMVVAAGDGTEQKNASSLYVCSVGDNGRDVHALRRCRSWAPRLQTIEENPAGLLHPLISCNYS